MLIGVIEAMQYEKIISFAAAVELEVVDSILSILPHPFHPSGSGFPVCNSVVRDWKTDVLTSSGASVGSNHEKLVSEMVECSPERLDHVAHYDGNILRNRFYFRNVIYRSAGDWIPLKLDAVRFSSHKSDCGGIKFTDVFIGPVDL